MIWPHVTKKNPCPICAKTDWCTIGERAVLCQRVQSDRPAKRGGWYHLLDFKMGTAVPKLKPRPAPPLLTGIRRMIERWADETSVGAFEDHAVELGVSPESLASLNMVYASEHQAWAFPMCDGYGEMIGVRLRSTDGRKWAVRGSRGGLFICKNGNNCSQIAYLLEGPTSTAAALTMGLYAIGRPSCNSGGDLVLTALRQLRISKVVIVADNDDKPNGMRPGFDGALKLAKELKGIRSVIWTPPTKDMRDFLKAGGTRQVIESEINNFVWKIYK